MVPADECGPTLANAQEVTPGSDVALQQERYSATRTWVWLIIVLLLLAIAFLPSIININRYQHLVAHTISNSIGRPVHMSAARLRLLPRPGFEIADFVVDEDPAFGAEPMLRAASVVASVRLVSIWRGQLEIARIHLDEPSLNLVRRGDGQWNFGSVLLKASTTPNAPTAQRHVGSAPRFPYIEATNARINFKIGDEKKPFSFLNADLSVWLDNPDEWRLRFAAQPVRTDLDLDLADTGVVKISGAVRRAAALNEVPLMLHAEWTKAPLGQLSRMLAGRDAGWRGDLEVRADITGTGENALLKTQLRASNVHRIEFAPREPMDMDANCQGTYTRRTHSLEDVACTSPVGNGNLLLHGYLRLYESPRGMQRNPSTTLDLQMERVPVSAALGLARSVREGFAPSLKAVGSIDGGFHYSGEAAGAARLRGGATVTELELSSPLLEHPLRLPSLKLTSAIDADAPAESVAEEVGSRRRGGIRRAGVSGAAGLQPAQTRGVATTDGSGQEAALLLSPVRLPTGGLTPLEVDGRFTRRGYQMHLTGNGDVKSMLAYSKAFGLLQYTVGPLLSLGTAALDLRTSGAWLTPIVDPDHPQTDALTEGQLQLKNARITTDYLAGPLDVIRAQAVFRGAEVDWDVASLAYGKLHGDGSLRYSQACAVNCTATFRLKFAALDAGVAQSTLLGGGGRTQFLDELLARLDHRAHPWPALNGTLEATTLTLQQLTFHDAKASLEINGNQVTMQSFNGRALGGSLHLAGTLDASGEQPAYAVQAVFSKVDAAEVATLFHENREPRENWERKERPGKPGNGQITGTMQLHLAGYKPADLASSAEGAFHWDWTQGSLPIEVLGATEGTENAGHFQRWSAEGSIAAARLTLTNSTMTPAPWTRLPGGSGAASIRGTISFNGELNLVVSPTANEEVTTTRASKKTVHRSDDAAEITNIRSALQGTITGTLSQPRLHIERAIAPRDQNASQPVTQ